MPQLLEQALEKTCLFAYTETDGLGFFHILIEMYRLRREIEFMDEDQAVAIYTSFLKKKQGKSTALKGIEFVTSVCKIKDKDILKKLENIPVFEQDNEYIRINNVRLLSI